VATAPGQLLEPASDDRLLGNQAGEPEALLRHLFPARRILLIWQPQNDRAQAALTLAARGRAVGMRGGRTAIHALAYRPDGACSIRHRVG
jgi:hypothetical protein